MASGLVFGTPGMTRRVPKEVLAKASMGHSAGLRDGSGRVLGHAARSEGVFERISERGSSKEVAKGVFRRALRRGLLEGLSSGAALVVRLKIYGPSGPASSD